MDSQHQTQYTIQPHPHTIRLLDSASDQPDVLKPTAGQNHGCLNPQSHADRVPTGENR